MTHSAASYHIVLLYTLRMHIFTLQLEYYFAVDYRNVTTCYLLPRINVHKLDTIA